MQPKTQQTKQGIYNIYCLFKDIIPEKKVHVLLNLFILIHFINSHSLVTFKSYLWYFIYSCFFTGTFWESLGRFVCEQMLQEQNGHQYVPGPEALERTGGVLCSCCQVSLGPPVQTHAGRGSGGAHCRIDGVPCKHCGNRQPGWQSESWTLALASALVESTAWLQKLPPDWNPWCRQMGLHPSQLLSQLSHSGQGPGFPHTAAEHRNSAPECQKTTNPWGPPRLQVQDLKRSPSLKFL